MTQTEGKDNNPVEQKEKKNESDEKADTNGQSETQLESKEVEDKDVSKKTNAPKLISKNNQK